MNNKNGIGIKEKRTIKALEYYTKKNINLLRNEYIPNSIAINYKNYLYFETITSGIHIFIKDNFDKIKNINYEIFFDKLPNNLNKHNFFKTGSERFLGFYGDGVYYLLKYTSDVCNKLLKVVKYLKNNNQLNTSTFDFYDFIINNQYKIERQIPIYVKLYDKTPKLYNILEIINTIKDILSLY